MDLFHVPPKKGIDVMAAECEVRGFNQCLVKTAQLFAVLEIYVSCKLALVNTPVVGIAKHVLNIREQAVHLPDHPVKGIRQLFLEHMVSHLLCPVKVLYIGK